ncbi:MAG: HDOD domain-containing protein [Candidatus Marinarcus sp.]|uniref:HDOD domain-containing protein n=1 Tax=Candidatus Marinarcus sp. TaxID=3100987 RepID=UPI003B00F4E0
MQRIILEEIEALPPLPKTVLEIEMFRKKSNKDISELLDIIDKDPLLIATLLKVANSALFSFRSKVETASKAVSLLGINLTISVVISSSLQELLHTNLSAYGIDCDDFARASNLASNLASMWLSRVSLELKEELILPVFLQETGKFIIANLIERNKQTELFHRELILGRAIKDVEQEFTGTTTSNITAAMFKKWELSENLFNVIECVDEIEKCPQSHLQKTRILEVLKTICAITDPMSEKNIQKGIEKATLYKFDVLSLQTAIKKLQEKLLNE